MAETDTAGSMLARDWRLEVQTAADEWTHVKGLKACTPVFEGSEQDDSTIDDQGYGSQIVTGIAARIEASGLRRGGGDEGAYEEDPGQAFLRDKGQKTGTANIVVARIYRTDDAPDAYQMTTTVKWTDTAASDPTALQEFSVTLSSRGKPESITKPAEGGTENP